jgi:hypothetical protein
MKNNKFENDKKAGKKTVKLNEISDKNTGEIYYVLSKGNKLQLMFMDGRCKI